MTSINQLNKKITKISQEKKKLERQRSTRIKQDNKKLKLKSGAHFISNNSNINLNNYTKFYAIPNDKLKRYQDNERHLRNIADQMVLINNTQSKHWQIQHVHLVTQWLAQNFRNPELKKETSKNLNKDKNHLDNGSLFNFPTKKTNKN